MTKNDLTYECVEMEVPTNKARNRCQPPVRFFVAKNSSGVIRFYAFCPEHSTGQFFKGALATFEWQEEISRDEYITSMVVES